MIAIIILVVVIVTVAAIDYSEILRRGWRK